MLRKCGISLCRSCPQCRTHSDYVVSANFFPKTPEEKEKVIKEFKEAMGYVTCWCEGRNVVFGADASVAENCFCISYGDLCLNWNSRMVVSKITGKRVKFEKKTFTVFQNRKM